MNNNLLVYKASAGSGKTYTLSAEYIARLLCGTPDTYRHILAVTFTNKATAEMKERILQYLWELGYTDTDFKEKIQEIAPHLTDEQIRTKAQTALKAIVHDYDHFRVETIDSFFQSLLSNLAHELGLTANFKVNINDKEVIEKSVDKMMKEIENTPEALVWVLDYIEERISEGKKWDISKDIKKLGNNLLKEKLLRAEDDLKTFFSNNQKILQYRKLLSEIKDEAYDHLKNAAEHLDHEICLLTNDYNNFSKGNNLRTYLQKLAEGTLDPSMGTTNSYIANTNNWLRKADQTNAFLIERAEYFRDILIEVEKMRTCCLSIVNSCKLSSQPIKPMRLLNVIAKEMEIINKENNHFMLAKTPLLFDQLIGESDTSFVLEKAGINFHHIMIDEFQDTSTLQWRNFKKLLIESLASEGNKCLLVGDLKQGIYRFRGGDWNILNNISNEFKNATPEIRTLDTNFRSVPRIIDFNNMYFPLAAKHLDNITGRTDISKIYEDVHQENDKERGGYVRIEIEKKDKEKTEDAENIAVEHKLAEEILHLNEIGIPFREMAILVRKNSECKEILKVFSNQYPEIPLISDEAFLLSSSPTVQFIIDTLCILNNPLDSISKVHIAQYYQKEILHESIEWDKLIKETNLYLPLLFTEEVERLREKPLYELCELIIRDCHLDKIEGSAPFLNFFLDQVMMYLEDNHSSISGFLKHWEETLSSKSIPSAEIDGVYILTIHKSKGLAFHTVLMPYNDWPLEQDLQKEILWCTPPAAPYNQAPLLPVQLGVAIRQSVYSEQYEFEHLQRRIENLNLQYVAFTRARQNLLVWANLNQPAKKGYTMSHLLADCLKDQCADEPSCLVYENGTPIYMDEEEKKQSSTKVQKSDKKNPLKISPQKEPTPFISNHFKGEFLQSNESKKFVSEKPTPTDQYINQGKLMHRLFSEIYTAADVEPALQRLLQEGLLPSAHHAETLGSFILSRIQEGPAALWFSPIWKIWNECNILTKDENGIASIQRPDRVMIGQDKTVVLDFKFGKYQPKHEEQIRNYISLLKKMTSLPIEGYLWYFYENKVHKVDPNNK